MRICCSATISPFVRLPTRSWMTCSSQGMRGEQPVPCSRPEGTIGSGDDASSRTVARRAAKRSGSHVGSRWESG
jgi:hypothetical protein